MNATMATIRKLVKKHGGAIERDGMGGYDILASPPGEEPMRRWIDAEVWCQPLPLGELDREERLERIEEVICMIEGGTEPYPEPNPQQERTGPMNATKKIKQQEDTDVAPPVYWIEERSEHTGRYIRLINCDYGNKQQAINQASDWSFNEGRRLRVVEIKETMVASF